MKIVHLTFGYPPDGPGGTEVYVGALARSLRQWGCESVIAAPAGAESGYLHDGTRVRRFRTSDSVANIRELYGLGDPAAAQRFASILDAEQPDILHLHAYTRAVSIRLVREAKLRNIPVVLTYHTATVSCLRGTLLHLGRDECDGRLDLGRCARCALQSHTKSTAASVLLGAVPSGAGKSLGALGLSGGIWTGLRMRELVQLYHLSVRELFESVDQIVVLCEWTKAMMLRNNVPGFKVTVCRHGLTRPVSELRKHTRSVVSSGPIRVAYFGRMEPSKGAHVVVEALRLRQDLDVQLHIYALPQGPSGMAYLRQLERLAGGDARVSFHPPVPNEQLVEVMQTYDLLAVPSMCLETGPLVVLEAFAAKTPVVGSNLGGIKELVRDGIDGMLVDAGVPGAWLNALRRFVADPELRDRLRLGIRAPRQMMDVAAEMKPVYTQVLEKRGAESSIA